MLHPSMPAHNWTDILIARGHPPISPGSFAIGLEAEMVRKNNYMIEKHETSQKGNFPLEKMKYFSILYSRGHLFHCEEWQGLG